MDFEEMLEQERMAKHALSESLQKSESSARKAQQLWSKGLEEFMRLSLPAIHFGWVSREIKAKGFFFARQETKYYFHSLGRCWVLRGNRMDGDANQLPPIVLTTKGKLYEAGQDIAESDLFDGFHKVSEIEGLPSTKFCALWMYGSAPKSVEPSYPDEYLKLLAKYAT